MLTDEDIVREKLMNYYRQKNETQIKNMYSLFALLFGVIFSGGMGYIPDELQIHVIQLLLVFIAPIYYVLSRMRYWSARAWYLMVIKPDKKRTYEEGSIYKENIYHRFERAVGGYVNQISHLGLKLQYFNRLRHKFLFLVIIPLFIYFIMIWTKTCFLSIMKNITP